MSVAEDVVHHRVLLAEDLATPFFRSLMDAFIESTRRDYDNLGGEALFAPDSTGELECTRMLAALRASESYCVATDMMELAGSVAPSMPDEPLLPYDLPSMAGFMWFQIPYQQIDLRRKILSTDCFLWDSRNNRVRIWHFTQKGNPNDWVNLTLRNEMGEEEFNRVVPHLTLNHAFTMRFGQELPRGVSWDTPLPFDAQVYVDRKRNPDGSSTWTMVTDASMDGLAEGEQPRMVRSPLAAFLVCLWRLCQQTLAAKDIEHPPRASRRRLGRAHLPDKPVTIIRLRKRESHPAHEEAGVEWSHRWMVRGHWRRQPYKEDGQVIYRHILIHPYLKGPEDKPLIVREKVNFLVR